MTDPFDSLNSQVTAAVAAVGQSLEQDSSAAETAVVAIAARHACAIALQDAVDHLRRMETLAAAATARALAQIADGERVEESEKLLTEARGSVTAALETVAEILSRFEPFLTPTESATGQSAKGQSNT